MHTVRKHDELQLMSFSVAVIATIIWLWLWVNGNPFAALLAALVLAFFWFTLPTPGMHPVWWMTAICFAAPWAPFGIRAYFLENSRAKLSLWPR